MCLLFVRRLFIRNKKIKAVKKDVNQLFCVWNMHHLYPVSKGDQLCPLGFHPQVRWPTRCKRCFRDYKDHGTKRGDDIVASSPSLTDTSRTR